MTHTSAKDDQYFSLIQKSLLVCRVYKPKFGKGSKGGLTLDEFRSLYQEDPFLHVVRP